MSELEIYDMALYGLSWRIDEYDKDDPHYKECEEKIDWLLTQIVRLERKGERRCR